MSTFISFKNPYHYNYIKTTGKNAQNNMKKHLYICLLYIHIWFYNKNINHNINMETILKIFTSHMTYFISKYFNENRR